MKSDVTFFQFSLLTKSKWVRKVCLFSHFCLLEAKVAEQTHSQSDFLELCRKRGKNLNCKSFRENSTHQLLLPPAETLE